MNALNKIIKEKILKQGPLPVFDFMNLALAHPKHGYYIKKDPLGKNGDFTTAPEISQLFGEMIAIYIANQAINHPIKHLIEIGPGKGTLMSDILRTLEKISPQTFAQLNITLIETSPTLTKAQQKSLSGYKVKWDTRLDCSKINQNDLIIGNEFFDALPIHQFEKIDNIWFERALTIKNDHLEWTSLECNKNLIPLNYQDNSFYEYNPYSETLVKYIARSGARAIFIDYGYTTNKNLTDTLQALKNHRYKDVLHDIGNQDLTTHVNFLRLHDLSEEENRKTTVTTQGIFLKMMGIEERTKQLMLKNPNKTLSLQKDLDRLIRDDTMGELFKVLTIE